jgi:mono/diheme cytochrome c family protein
MPKTTGLLKFLRARLFLNYVSRLTKTLALLALALRLGAARSQTAPQPAREDKSVYAELLKAPPKAASRPNPLATDPEAAAAGTKLFNLHCAECHGEMAAGGKKAPSLLAPEVQQATPGALFWLLTNGVVRRGMPVWSKLPEPQRWQLVTYIKSLGPASVPANGEKPPSEAAASVRP